MARLSRNEIFVSPATAKPAVRSVQTHLLQIKVIPFEEDYYDVMYNPHKVWDKYQEKMIRVVNKLANWKNFNKDDLFQQSYEYFIYFCKNYDPYWNDGFIPFDKYLFKNMIIKLRAFIQRYYVKGRRERPVEFSEFVSDSTDDEDQISYDIDYTDSKIYNDYVYSQITERQRKILDLTLQGYKQQEIGKILNISQSRVSVIKKRTLNKLQSILANNGTAKSRLDF